MMDHGELGATEKISSLKLRTFIVEGERIKRVVEAHDVEFGEQGELVFVVYFIHPEHNKPARASNIVINGHSWDMWEEVNESFPSRIEH